MEKKGIFLRSVELEGRFHNLSGYLVTFMDVGGGEGNCACAMPALIRPAERTHFGWGAHVSSPSPFSSTSAFSHPFHSIPWMTAAGFL